MSTTGTPRSVELALRAVADWQAEAISRHKTELREADQEAENIRQAILNLQEQLEALGRYRQDLLDKGQRVRDEVVQRSYDAIFVTLAHQARDLTARTQQVTEAHQARQAALGDLLKGSAVAPLMREYEQFKTAVEPSLSMLPDSYRSVILKHHASVVAQLREHMARVAGGPTEIDADDLQLDVVYAIDAPDGPVELLMFVLPVTEAAYSQWSERNEDLQLHLMARVVQGIHQALQSLGLSGVQVNAGGHQGLLAIEAELAEVHVEALVDVLKGALAQSVVDAAEIRAAHISIKLSRVAVDHLLPSEDADMETLEVSGD